MSVTRSVVLGIGSALPERVVTNDEIARKVDTSDEWIVQRTGIRQRHIAGEGETSSTLGLKAAEAALKDAGKTKDDLDLIIVATTTPDLTFPSTATQIQSKLGMMHGAAFDVQAVCSGFVYGLTIADKFLASGTHRTALVIGVDTLSRIVDWNDRTTCVLFGDGAGAVVLQAQEQEGEVSTDRGVLTTHIRSDGRHGPKLCATGGPSTTGSAGYVTMEGKEVFKHAVGMITDVITDAYKATGFSSDDLTWFVPHQANKRIIDSSADKLGIAPEKVVITVDRHGNTSAASIPLALATAYEDGRIKKGDLVMLEAMGGGFTWGSALIRW